MYTLMMTILLLLFYLLSKKFFTFRKYLILVNTIICLIYITWRVTVIPINSGVISFIIGFALFAAEILGLLSFFNFQYIFSRKYTLKKKTLNEFNSSNLPSIDILICTYNEPISLLEKTIAACTNLEYPHNKLKIHICDDGRRKELKKLCSKYNLNYITRDNNIAAKAGNINNALQFVKGDLFVVLDADMIPKKEFLLKTVGYFSDENVAFVQTPQVYYNQDMYQYNLSKNIPNEQDFFMRDIQEARAASNAVLHVGTNAVFRRKYINEIGGYPTFSITEDMAVGMFLQEKGYDSIFVNEELVLGLSASTFTELVKQRDRWCRGNLQVLKHFNILTSKGLSFNQKISYFDGIIYWFCNLQKMIYIICPLIYLFTGKVIIDTSLETLLKLYIPFFLGQLLIFRTFSPGTRNLLWTHLYEVAMAPHLSVSVIKELLSLNINFNVTPKDITYDKKKFHSKIVIPHITILLISIMAWVYSSLAVWQGKLHFGAFILNLVWSIFNYIGARVSLKAAYQKPLFRSSERIFVDPKPNVTLEINSHATIQGVLVDISEKGVGVSLNSGINLNPDDEITLTLCNTLFNCTIRRINENSVGLKFNELSPEQMKLIMSLFTENMKPYYNLNKTPNYITDDSSIEPTV